MLTPHRVEVCPQGELVFTCNGSLNSDIIQIEWTVQFAVESVQINGRIRSVNNNVFLGVEELAGDSLGHMYFYVLTSLSPAISSTLSTTPAPHLNGSTVQCIEVTNAGISTESDPAMVVLTGTLHCY